MKSCFIRNSGVNLKYILVLTITLIIVFSFSYPAHALCVNVKQANLRSDPGIEYKKSGIAFKYMPLKELRRDSKWYKVQNAAGDIHWIYEKLVTDKIKCAVVRASFANIHNGPGKNYTTTYKSPAMKNKTFQVLKETGSWVKVKDKFNNTGWILRKLLWIE